MLSHYRADCYFYINVFASLGLLVALYSIYVKKKYLANPKKYKAVCDINENMSCTRVLTSEYGSGFGIVGKLFGKDSSLNVSNSYLGAAYYVLQILLTFFHNYEIAMQIGFYTSLISVIGSVYLAYILFFVLKDVCIVCNLSYIMNGFLLYYNSRLMGII